MSGPTIAEKSLASTFPKGEIAWEGMQSGVQREINDGLAIQINRDRLNGKAIITDFFPFMTTLIKEWEDTFRLPTGEFLTQAQRIARLLASWTKKSPATYTEMNEIYALSGIPVVARPLESGEDPRTIANSGIDILVYETVTGIARTGQLSESSRTGAFTIIPGTTDPIVMADGRPGDAITNYITVTGVARTGQLSTSSRVGAFEGSRLIPPNPTIPDDDWTWGMIYIIEGSDGDFAQVPIELREAFEFLTYKIKPQMMWAIARVEYF